MFFFEKYECDIARYVDDNAPQTYDSYLCTVLSRLTVQIVSSHDLRKII